MKFTMRGSALVFFAMSILLVGCATPRDTKNSQTENTASSQATPQNRTQTEA